VLVQTLGDTKIPSTQSSSARKFFLTFTHLDLDRLFIPLGRVRSSDIFHFLSFFPSLLLLLLFVSFRLDRLSDRETGGGQDSYLRVSSAIIRDNNLSLRCSFSIDAQNQVLFGGRWADFDRRYFGYMSGKKIVRGEHR